MLFHSNLSFTLRPSPGEKATTKAALPAGWASARAARGMRSKEEEEEEAVDGGGMQSGEHSMAGLLLKRLPKLPTEPRRRDAISRLRRRCGNGGGRAASGEELSESALNLQRWIERPILHSAHKKWCDFVLLIKNIDNMMMPEKINTEEQKLKVFFKKKFKFWIKFL